MYALIENGAVKQYPYGLGQLKAANPLTSFPAQATDEMLASFGVQRVFFATPPKSDKEVADMEQRLVAMAVEIAALQAKERTAEEEQQLQSMVVSHATETQILQSLPTPYSWMASVLVEGTPVIADDRWTQVWTVRDMTTDEVTSRNEGQAASVRAERNDKLVASDWTQLADAPVDKAVWATYRQALRDITAQSGFPWEITWPNDPNWVAPTV